MNIFGIITAGLFAILATGCDLIKTIAPCSDGHCQPPVEAVSEISTNGVTISPRVRPFPEDLPVDIYTDEITGRRYAFIDDVDLYFSPNLDFSDVDNPDPLANDWSDHPYIYAFSKEEGGVFNPVKPLIPYNTTLLEGTDFAPLAVTNEPPALVTFGNHILEAEAAFPLEVTHVEIWFRRERENEFELMKRVNLDDLIVWRDFIKPRIELERSL